MPSRYTSCRLRSRLLAFLLSKQIVNGGWVLPQGGWGESPSATSPQTQDSCPAVGRIWKVVANGLTRASTHLCRQGS